MFCCWTRLLCSSVLYCKVISDTWAMHKWIMAFWYATMALLRNFFLNGRILFISARFFSRFARKTGALAPTGCHVALQKWHFYASIRNEWNKICADLIPGFLTLDADVHHILTFLGIIGHGGRLTGAWCRSQLSPKDFVQLCSGQKMTDEPTVNIIAL